MRCCLTTAEKFIPLSIMQYLIAFACVALLTFKVLLKFLHEKQKRYSIIAKLEIYVGSSSEVNTVV